MARRKEVQIIGGGYSGLVQAYYLVQAGYSVSIFEKEPRVGGLLGSKKNEQFLIEQAANAFLANKDLELLMDEVGVRLVQKTAQARKRFIYRDGKLRRWPVGWVDSLPLVTFLLGRRWKNPKFAPHDDESLRDWGYRILGVELTDNLLEPAMQGVYASTSDHLNGCLVLNSLNKKTKKGKFVGSVSPKNGMREFVEKLQRYLLKNGVNFQLQKNVDLPIIQGPTILAVDLNTLRSWANKKMVGLHPSILETRSASLSSVTLGFNDPFQKIEEGFGCLFPQKADFHSLGVLFNHSIFPGRVAGGASETWILNDQKMAFSQMSQTALLRYVHSDRSQLKHWVEPESISVSQWPDRIPLYDNHLSHFLEEQSQVKSDFLLVGNYLGDLGLSKILFRAQENVAKIKGGYFG